jgi:hypothetical protein
MAVWTCWVTALAFAFVVLVAFELIEAGLAFGSAQYTGKADDRAMVLYMIPAMTVFVAAVGYVTVVWPALRSKRNRRGGQGDQ